MNIGIIGFGRFGQLIAKHLFKDHNLFVYSRTNKTNLIKKLNANPASLKQACSQDIIIYSVSISAFENIIKKTKQFVKNDSIIVDVCSVKEYPVKIMKKYFSNNQILATHPLFGPDSASNSLKGQKIVLCNINLNNSKYQMIKSFLKKKQLKIIEATPAEHDKQIAKSQILAHLIGRTLTKSQANQVEITTLGYNDLMDLKQVVENDSLQLFKDMNKYNRFAKKTRKDFIHAISNIDKKLK